MAQTPQKATPKISYKAQISCKNLDCFFVKKPAVAVSEEVVLVEEAK